MNKSARIVRRTRRTQRTRHLLHEALGSLIREKPYDSIVVRDILERANVGRSTFYTHFRDKHDLLVSGIHDILASAPATRLSSARESERLTWFSLPLFEHVARHRQSSSLGVGPEEWARLHEHLRQVLTDILADDLKTEGHRRRSTSLSVPPDLLARHIASTFVLTLSWWVESRSTLSPNEANDLFRSLVAPSFNR